MPGHAPRIVNARRISGKPLVYHHEHAWAQGGATSVENIALRCRAHNALAAEEDFGREFMQRKRRGDIETVANE